MKRCCLLLASLIVVITVVCSNTKSDIDKAGELWKSVYGENRVVKLEDRNIYAYFTVGIDSPEEQTLRLNLIEPSKHPGWGLVYEGDKYSLELVEGNYKPGDTVKFILKNNSTTTIYPENGFVFEIKVGDMWYPVINAEDSGGLCERYLIADAELELGISPLFRASEQMIKYDAAKERYVADGANYNTEARLIPGNYRYMIKVRADDKNCGESIYWLACYFDIVE